MFLGSFDAGGDFRDTGIAGMYRFLGRVWRLVTDSNKLKDPSTIAQDDALTRVMHRTIKKITEDLENLRYNTAIAHIMEFVNEISNVKAQMSNLPREVIETLLLLLAPFAPHMTEELYQRLSAGNSKFEIRNSKFLFIHLHPWPIYDEKYLVETEVTIVVQVNGKTRDVIKVKSQKSTLRLRSGQEVKSEVEKIAKESEKVTKHLAGKSIKKVIFVPGKLINFVV